jgi:hypothetical protein
VFSLESSLFLSELLMPSSSQPHTGTFEQNCCHSTVPPPPGVSKEAEMHDELEYVRLIQPDLKTSLKT